MRVTQGVHSQPAHEVEVAPPLHVVDEHALSPGDGQGISQISGQQMLLLQLNDFIQGGHPAIVNPAKSLESRPSSDSKELNPISHIRIRFSVATCDLRAYNLLSHAVPASYQSSNVCIHGKRRASSRAFAASSRYASEPAHEEGVPIPVFHSHPRLCDAYQRGSGGGQLQG